MVSVLLLVLVRPALRAAFTSGTGCRNRPRRWRARARWCSTGWPATKVRSKLDGEVWTARPFNDNDVYEPGDHVTVVHIDGATAVVSKSRLEERLDNYGRNPSWKVPSPA